MRSACTGLLGRGRPSPPEAVRVTVCAGERLAQVTAFNHDREPPSIGPPPRTPGASLTGTRVRNFAVCRHGAQMRRMYIEPVPGPMISPIIRRGPQQPCLYVGDEHARRTPAGSAVFEWNKINTEHPQYGIDLRLPSEPFLGYHDAPLVVLSANPTWLRATGRPDDNDIPSQSRPGGGVQCVDVVIKAADIDDASSG
jgi:hypothetical protein